VVTRDRPVFSRLNPGDAASVIFTATGRGRGSHGRVWFVRTATVETASALVDRDG